MIRNPKDILLLKIEGLLWCLRHPIVMAITLIPDAYDKFPERLVDKWHDNPASYVWHYKFSFLVKCIITGVADVRKVKRTF